MTKGYVVDVTDVTPQQPTWYLPLLAVVNKNKPDKTRYACDAAARAFGKALNSFLLTGPDLLNPLPCVLMRFRERFVAATTDVGEMFHQVLIIAKDRDAQRFLYWEVGAPAPRELRMEVMMFGAACSPTTAQYVQRMNAEQFKDEFPEAVKEIQQNYYVDDQLSSFDNEETAARVIRDVIHIQRQAGFELKKWRCSIPELLESLQEVGEDAKSLASCDKVLGMLWSSSDDTLRFATQDVMTMKDAAPLTRRRILSGTMSLFDPLGLATRTVVKGKMIVRACNGLNWDEEVSESVQRRWKEWCDELATLNDVVVSRFHGVAPDADKDLHVFVDASEQAFAAAAYIRGQNREGKMIASLVMARSRVVPIEE